MKVELLTDIKYKGNFIKAGVAVDLGLPAVEIEELIQTGAIRELVEAKPLKEVEVKQSTKPNKTSSIIPGETGPSKKELIAEAEALGLKVKGSFGDTKLKTLIAKAKEEANPVEVVVELAPEVEEIVIDETAEETKEEEVVEEIKEDEKIEETKTEEVKE